MEGIVSLSFNKINRINLQQPYNENNNLIKAQINLIINADKYISPMIKKTKTASFSDLVPDIPFNKFGANDKSDIFETNYIIIKDNYNEKQWNT